MVATFNEVLEAIDTERDYQERIWRSRCADLGVAYTPDPEKPVGKWLVFIRGYYNDAIQQASHVAEGGDMLNIVRKLAGLCVACMETHGAFQRRNDGCLHPFFNGPSGRRWVYSMILHEREYQDRLSGNRTDFSEKSVEEYLVMFGHYLTSAFEAWTLNAGCYESLKDIGKMAAIAVHCMEDHGAPHR